MTSLSKVAAGAGTARPVATRPDPAGIALASTLIALQLAILVVTLAWLVPPALGLPSWLGWLFGGLGAAISALTIAGFVRAARTIRY